MDNWKVAQMLRAVAEVLAASSLTFRVSDGSYDDLDNTTFSASNEREFKRGYAAAVMDVRADHMARMHERQHHKGGVGCYRCQRLQPVTTSLNVMDSAGKWAVNPKRGASSWADWVAEAGFVEGLRGLSDTIEDRVHKSGGPLTMVED